MLSSHNACLQVIRSLMCVLSWPLLNRLGYPITWKEAVVLSWSGLRGAGGPPLAWLCHRQSRNSGSHETVTCSGRTVVEDTQNKSAPGPGSKAPLHSGVSGETAFHSHGYHGSVHVEALPALMSWLHRQSDWSGCIYRQGRDQGDLLPHSDILT